MLENGAKKMCLISKTPKGSLSNNVTKIWSQGCQNNFQFNGIITQLQSRFKIINIKIYNKIVASSQISLFIIFRLFSLKFSIFFPINLLERETKRRFLDLKNLEPSSENWPDKLSGRNRERSSSEAM